VASHRSDRIDRGDSDRDLFRLRERDRRRTASRSLAASGGADMIGQEFSARQAAISVAPPLRRLPLVVRGRDALLARLRQHIARADDRVCVLAGLGGMGKSTIALRLAADMMAERRRVWGVNAENRSQMATALMQIARDDLEVDPARVLEALTGRRNAADLFWSAVDRAGGVGAALLVMDIDRGRHPGIAAVPRDQPFQFDHPLAQRGVLGPKLGHLRLQRRVLGHERARQSDQLLQAGHLKITLSAAGLIKVTEVTQPLELLHPVHKVNAYLLLCWAHDKGALRLCNRSEGKVSLSVA